MDNWGFQKEEKGMARKIAVSSEQKAVYAQTAEALSGGHRRQYMGNVVNQLGKGAQAWAERELGWARSVVRTGQRELAEGVEPRPLPSGLGRPRTEEKHPQLAENIEAILADQSQTDPTFHTTRMYTRLSVQAIRQALIDEYCYDVSELPSAETLRTIINGLGYKLRAVQKSRPKKNPRNGRHL